MEEIKLSEELYRIKDELVKYMYAQGCAPHAVGAMLDVMREEIKKARKKEKV